MIALQKKIELDKLDKLVASKYVEHRKKIQSNHSNNIAKDDLKPKRMMYSFNKLNDASVITIVNNPVPKAEEEDDTLMNPIQLEGNSIGSNGVLKNKTVVFSQNNYNDRSSFKGRSSFKVKRGTLSKKLRAASIDVSPGQSWHHLSTSRVNSIRSVNNSSNHIP